MEGAREGEIRVGEPVVAGSCQVGVGVVRNLALGEGGDVELLKGLLFKLRQERVLEDSDVVFFKGHQNKGLGGDFAYFRCIGLPFQISKGEIIQKLVEPERFSIKSYGLSLIF